MKILNTYSGIGGNRKNWDGGKHDITAVEINEEIAEEYRQHYPEDKVIVGDAHSYIKENYEKFDFIWSSPPCQTHSQLLLCNIGQDRDQPKYPDMKLWQEIIFLRQFFKGNWVVENVRPYYGELIPAQKVGRHYIWSNFPVPDINLDRDFNYSKGGQGSLQDLEEWFGIQLYNKQLKIRGNNDPSQVLRNAVHPKIGEAILKARNTKQETLSL